MHVVQKLVLHCLSQGSHPQQSSCNKTCSGCKVMLIEQELMWCTPWLPWKCFQGCQSHFVCRPQSCTAASFAKSSLSGQPTFEQSEITFTKRPEDRARQYHEMEWDRIRSYRSRPSTSFQSGATVQRCKVPSAGKYGVFCRLAPADLELCVHWIIGALLTSWGEMSIVLIKRFDGLMRLSAGQHMESLCKCQESCVSIVGRLLLICIVSRVLRESSDEKVLKFVSHYNH